MPGLSDFFTNKEATAKEEVDVKAPAFSLTKVAATIGIIVAGFGVAGAKIEDVTAVKVAAIGGAALVLVAYFGVAAVDLIVRQRAAEAKLRWGGGAASSNGDSTPVGLVADLDDLILQSKHSGEEYELRFAERDGDKVTLVARKDGKALEPTFQPRT